MIRKIIVIAILMLVYAAALSACNETQPSAPELQNINLKLNWKHGTSFIGFYIAQSQGFFADEGLDVSIEELSDPSLASEIPAQILNGEFEFGIAASDLARAQIKGLELTAFGNIIKLSPAAFFVRKDSGIHTPADFAGRTVVIKSQSWQEILEGFLENAGLVIDDVEVVPGGYDLTPFYEGDVEIWAGFITKEVVRVRMQGIDILTLPLYEYGRRGSSVTIFTSQELLATNSDLAVRFLRASLRGWQYAIDNPSQAVTDMLALYPELTDEFEYYLASFQSTIPLIIPSGTNLGYIDCEVWDSHDGFDKLETTNDLCTQDIFLEVISEK